MALLTLKVVDGDFVVDPATGRFVTVSGRDKARQDVRLTLGKVPGVQGDGCGLDELMATMPDSPESLRTDVVQRVRTGLSRLVELEARGQARSRAPEEQVVGVGHVFVWPTTDPTKFQFRVNVRTAAGAPTAVGGVLVTPPA